MRFYSFAVAAILVSFAIFEHSSAQSSGNTELMSAYESALVRLMQNGVYGSLFDDGDSNTPLISDCVPQINAYPWPSNASLTVNGTFANVLARKKLIIGVVDNDQTPWYKPTATTPSVVVEGLIPSLETQIAALISQQYSVAPSLAIDYRLYSTSNLMFNALANGEIDMTNGFMAIGSFLNSTVRRRTAFAPSCTIFARDRKAYVLVSQNITSLSSLRNTTGYIVATSGASNAAILSTLFGDSHVRAYLEDDDVIAAMQVGNVTAAADIIIPTADQANYTSFALGLASSSASFFRRDAAVARPAPPQVANGQPCTPTASQPTVVAPTSSSAIGDTTQSVIVGVAIALLALLIIVVLFAVLWRKLHPVQHSRLHEDTRGL